MSTSTAELLPEDDSSNGERVPCRPFLKWAGGKTQLLPELLKRVPKSFNRYYEPFVGGGALFFALQPKEAFLSDLNNDLINIYEVITESVDLLIIDLKKHIYEKEYYYSIRDIDRSEEFKSWNAVQKASRFLYLNKTCFNGLYRVNSKGQFNVPIGRYSNPTICDADNLRACHQALQGAKLSIENFQEAVKGAQKRDFVYFDPPYAPLSDTANFTSYDKEGFGEAEQKQLYETVVDLDRRGVSVMLSNSAVPLILDLYKDFNIERVQASRAINSKGADRGKIDELIVTNYSTTS